MRRGSSTSSHRIGGRQGVARALAVAVVVVAGLTPPAASAAAPAAPRAPLSVLVFHGPAAEQQDPVARATQALKELGQAGGMAVVEATDPAVFTAAELARHRAVVFLSSDGATLSRDQEAALQN
jgi:hypothetical protein